MILWRISNHADLSGQGGLLHAGRWHHRGRPVVYLAESPASALLEALVHVEAAGPADLPRDYQLLEVALPDGLALREVVLSPDELQRPIVTRRIGDAWLAAADSLLLRVPSAVVGRSHNLLFNPRHTDAAQARIVQVTRHPFDARLLAQAGPASPIGTARSSDSTTTRGADLPP